MSGPTRMLAWKEWREQRPIVLSGLAAVAVLPFVVWAGSIATGRTLDREVLLDSIYLVIGLLVWPIFAAAAGALALANEKAEGTLGFLLSRPVSRARVWCVKVSLGWLAVLGVMAGSLLIAWALGGLMGVPEPLQHLETISLGELIGLSLPLLLLVFACSVLCSTFLSRSLTAAAAGLVTSPLVLLGIAALWWRLDLRQSLNPDPLIVQVAAAGLFILWTSFWFFSRDERRGVKASATKTAAAWLAALAATGAVPMIWLQAQGRLSPGTAVLSDIAIHPSGGLVAFTAMREDGGFPRIWLVRADTGGIEQVAGRLTAEPTFSPDGRWMAYLSMRGLLGLRSDHVSLRVMSLDGSQDRLLDDRIATSWYAYGSLSHLTFSPDSSRLAMTSADTLLVVSLRGAPTVRRSLSDVSLADRELIGWTADGEEVLLMTPPWRESEDATVISAFNPTSGKLRNVYESPRPARSLYWSAPPSGISRLPVSLQAEKGQPSVDLLVDVTDGSQAPLASSGPRIHPLLDLSADGNLLTYVSGDEIHVRDLVRGTDRMLASFPDDPVQALLSPDGDSVLVTTKGSQKEPSASVMLVDRSGSVSTVTEGWWPLAWSGDRRAILSGQSNGEFTLAMVDVDTKEVRRFYPRAGEPE